MNLYFSDDTTLMSIVLKYLYPKEIAKYRQTQRQSLTDVSYCKGQWEKYLQTIYPIKQCEQCSAICSVRQLDYCSLCERRVCIDHLYLGNFGTSVWCGNCC